MKYKIDRRVFINWLHDDDILYMKDVRKQLILGSEYIITAEELLACHESVPTSLLKDYTGVEKYIEGEKCELIYKQPQDA